MGFINFGNRIKHRSFDYIPRYYDAEKEEREKLKRMYGAESDLASKTRMAQDRIKSGFRAKYRATEDAYSSRSKKRSNRILLYIMIVMVIICYVFLTEYLPDFAAQFGD